MLIRLNITEKKLDLSQVRNNNGATQRISRFNGLVKQRITDILKIKEIRLKRLKTAK